MKKEWYKHYLIAFAFIFLLAGFFIYTISQVRMTGFYLYDTPNSACGQDNVDQDSQLGANSECAFENGVTLTANAIVLNCNNYFLKDDQGHNGITVNSDGTTIKKCNISEWDTLIEINGDETIIQDTSLSISRSHDILLAAGKTATLLNVTDTLSKETVGAGASLIKQWYANITVRDSSGVVEGATVQIVNGSQSFSSTTDSTGAAWFNATQYINAGGTITNHSNYTITVSKTGYDTNTSEFILRASPAVTERIVYITESSTPYLDIPPNYTFPLLPETNYNSSSTQLNFSCNATDDIDLRNITIWIWNNTGLWNTTTKWVNGTFNITNYTITLTETNYTWTCSAADNSSNFTFSSTNHTLLIDTSPPEISLESPADATSSTATTWTFYFNATDSGVKQISNCSLIINNAIDSTNTTITNAGNNSITKTLSVGTYTWKINCTDSLSNQGSSSARTLTISDSGGGGGGGGGGSSCTSECTSGAEEKRCASSISLEKRTCGNYDSDSCLEWGPWITTSCSLNLVCVDGSCITETTIIGEEDEECSDECDPREYPRCSNVQGTAGLVERAALCTKEKTAKCYSIKYIYCQKGQYCKEGACIKNITGCNPFCPSSCIETEAVPDFVIDTATYTAGIVVAVSLLYWIWLVILSAMLPFLLLRLRHYAVFLMDSRYFKFRDSEEVFSFVNLLGVAMEERIILASQEKNFYKFLFEKSGFLEVQTDKETIINAHFSKKKKAKLFKTMLARAASMKLRQEKIPDLARRRIIDSIAITKESVSIIAALRSISRKKKMQRYSSLFR